MISSRLRKVAIGCAAALMVPLIILGWWGINRAREVSEWNARAAEFPSIDELRAPKIPEEEKAATVYRRAWEALELSPEQEADLSGSEDPEVLLSILEQNQDAFRLLREATQIERCRFEPAYSEETAFADLPHLRSLRRLIDLTRAEVLIALHNGEVERTLDAVQVRVRVANHLLQVPYGMLEFLNAKAQIERAAGALQVVLARSIPTDHQSASLRAALDSINPHEALVTAYRVDVAEGLSYLDQTREAMRIPSNPAAGGFFRWQIALNRAKYMQLSMLEIQRLQRPWREVASLDPILAPDDAFYIWIQSLPPHFGQIQAARDEIIANCQMMRVALDIAAFQAEHGALPDSLDALPQAHEDEYSLDPFSGERLRYEPGDGAAYRLWSIGRNLRDDGGLSGREAVDRDRSYGEHDLVFSVDPQPQLSVSEAAP